MDAKDVLMVKPNAAHQWRAAKDARYETVARSVRPLNAPGSAFSSSWPLNILNVGNRKIQVGLRINQPLPDLADRVGANDNVVNPTTVPKY
jgi:hypothetical protein